MDRSKETELSASTPPVRAKKSVQNVGVPTGQPRRNNSEDVIMREPIQPRITFVGGSRLPNTLARKSFNPIGDSTQRSISSSAANWRNKTTSTKSISPHLVATKSLSTPRVRFAQQKSTRTVHRSSPLTAPAQNPGPSSSSAPRPSIPARKIGSQFPQKQVTPTVPPTPFSVKVARPFLPLWQQLDEEHERVYKPKRNIRRISSTRPTRGIGGNNVNLVGMRDKANIAPKLQFRLDGEMDISSSEHEDEQQNFRPPMKVPIKLAGSRQVGVKKSAARKVEFENATPSDESSEGGETDTDQEDQLLPEEYDLPLNQRLDGEPHVPLRASTIFNPSPQITIALPQIKAEPEDDLPLGEPDLGPPEALINAIEALTINPTRMQATRQLPFLRRNLRQGFVSRCADVLIPIHPDRKHVSLEVTYEYVDGIVYQAKIEDWLCPLCNLFGKFTTQATLHCHLKWDHQEVVSDWEKIEDSDVQQKWGLQIMIPQDDHEDGEAPQDESEDEGEQDQEEEAEIPDEHIPESPSLPVSTPFPSVSLSPPPAHQEPDPERKATLSPIAKSKLLRETPPPPTYRSIEPSSSRSRSTTAMSRTTSATTTRATPRIPLDTRYPTPPPPDDPLGPSARPPYLPAYSDYGGPTVYYSCRPGGACLFDLLDTLPTKEFGVLEWEVLDREEEIYESDDVKEEYKVMQALWARWIMLHRNEFIANYLQGTIAFVNYYWRMIHRAAGWDALRYWLLILCATRFLKAHEVAQVLVHYEELTGMAFWCDSG